MFKKMVNFFFKSFINIFHGIFVLQAALLVASMCLDFKIHEKQLWNGVIQQILSFGLVSIKDFIFEH
jgi:hypothetical protein